MSYIIELFSYTFIQRAMISGILISLCAALLGVILVQKRYSLIGHGLGDVGFASTSLAVALGLPILSVSIPVVVAAACLIMFYSQKVKAGGDVAIGMVATVSLSAGVIITALSGGFNVDVSNYMFGSILAMSDTDVILSIILSAVIVLLYIFFYNRLFLITCDEAFAKSAGINVSFYQFLIALLTALTVVLGMRMMGSLLISSLIIFPAVTARKLVESFRAVVLTSVIISIVGYVAGIFCSFLLNLPTGASIVLVDVVILLVVCAVARMRRK